MAKTKARDAPKRNKQRRTKPALTATRVAYLGTRLATLLGFRPLGVAQAARLIAEGLNAPLLFENGDYRLWIDLYYIAVEKLDAGCLVYVYITRHHIAEEIRDDSLACKHGNGFLEAPTKAQFAAALGVMRKGASQSALRGTRADSGLCGADAALDLQAPWYAP